MLHGSVCSLAECAVSGRVCSITACAVTGRVSSTTACAASGRVFSTSACAFSGRGSVSVQQQPVMCQGVLSSLQQLSPHLQMSGLQLLKLEKGTKKSEN